MDTRTHPDAQADERRTLTEFLEYYRATLLLKANGLTDGEARRASVAPSELTILGLIRHMAEVERLWFRRCWMDEDAGPIYYGEAHPTGDGDGDFHPAETDTLAEGIETWLTEVERAREVVAGERSLDALSRRVRDHDPRQPNLRWILVHMIEEYARHCGHADLIRQAIDGVTGD